MRSRYCMITFPIKINDNLETKTKYKKESNKNVIDDREET